MSQTSVEFATALPHPPITPDRAAGSRARRGAAGRWPRRIGLAGGVALLAIADFAAALAAPHLASALLDPAPTMAAGPVNWLLYGGVTVIALLSGGLYALGPARAPLEHAGALLRGLLAAHVLVLLRIALLRPVPVNPPLSGSVFWAAGVFGFAAVLLLGERLLIAAWWRRFEIAAPRGASALVTGGMCDRGLCTRLDRLADRRLGYMFCWGAASSSGLRTIADVMTFDAMIRSGQIDDIVVFIRRTDDAQTRDRIDALLARLADQPLRVRLAFDAVAEIGAAGLATGQTLRMVTVLDRPIRPLGAALKRGIDIAGAGILLLLTAPLLAAIALALRTGGPVLFRQRRIGLGGTPFTVFKFRTMRPAAAPRHAPPRPTLQARPGDRRITRLGAVLRRFSLDELPQLVNVLRGEMSLVGPRPHAPHTSTGSFTFEQAIAFYGVRHRVKPGLTGLAQVHGLRGPADRHELVAARIAADLDYIERWSPWLDLAILLRTIPAVLGGRNAC